MSGGIMSATPRSDGDNSFSVGARTDDLRSRFGACLFFVVCSVSYDSHLCVL